VAGVVIGHPDRDGDGIGTCLARPVRSTSSEGGLDGVVSSSSVISLATASSFKVET
jgi:hypothetical protein